MKLDSPTPINLTYEDFQLHIDSIVDMQFGTNASLNLSGSPRRFFSKPSFRTSHCSHSREST